MLYTSDLLINHTRLSLLEYEIKQVSVKQPGTFFSNSKKKEQVPLKHQLYYLCLLIKINKTSQKGRQKKWNSNSNKKEHGQKKTEGKMWE